MNKIAVISSQFNKELVAELYSQAHKEFTKYRSHVREVFSEDSKVFDKVNKLKDLQTSEFMSLIDKNADKQEDRFLKSFERMMILDLEPFWVPGAGEIPLAVKWAVENKKARAVLSLGVIIRGETSHYDFLCNLLKNALWDLQKTYSLPIVFSILMVENREQAEDRIKSNRGAEGMRSLLQMMELEYCIKNE